MDGTFCFLRVPAQHQLMHQFFSPHTSLDKGREIKTESSLAPPTITESLVLIINSSGGVLREANVCDIAGPFIARFSGALMKRGTLQCHWASQHTLYPLVHTQT